MQKKRVLVVGRGSLADALATAVGVTAIERPAAPSITRNGGALLADESEQVLRQRLTNADGIHAFREILRTALPQAPELRDTMAVLSARFSAHEGYPKLVALMTDLKAEMDKPEFDYGDPERLRRWVNWMFSRKSKQ
jgi:hypothetical protein